jgi:hypothetical protein
VDRPCCRSRGRQHGGFAWGTWLYEEGDQGAVRVNIVDYEGTFGRESHEVPFTVENVCT